MSSGQCDAIVIGAGIIGGAIALELSRQQRDVVVIDAWPAPGMGSTSASSAIVRVHYTRRNSVAAARDCYFDWLAWPEYLGFDDPQGTITLVNTGALVLDGTEALRRAFTSNLDSMDIDYEHLDATELGHNFPALDARVYGPPALPDSDAFWKGEGEPLGGFYYRDAGYVDDPQLAARNLCAAAVALGAIIRYEERVTTILQKQDRVAGVRLASGANLLAPVVVNAAGPASDLLNVLAGVTADMSVRGRPLRTETHELPAPDGFALGDGGTFVTDLDLGVAFRPQGNGRLHVSSIEPACDPVEWVDDPWNFDTAATDAAYTRQTRRVGRRIPSLRIPNRPVGVGALYDVTPDWTPIFDRSSLDGFYLACGTSGNAFKIAPMAGRAIAAIISATEAGYDHDSHPVQLHAAHSDIDIDLGSFSRLRCVDAASPRNVIA
ncbi:MAG TPA: FAD-dependent oxidoreductase [Pirellulales bacterium]|nr:FAD-dependent oxidoreductase [Pirellulales bacterium]